ncbi:hypothetical protein D3C86_1905180 [compost metagenome]
MMISDQMTKKGAANYVLALSLNSDSYVRGDIRLSHRNSLSLQKDRKLWGLRVRRDVFQ